jgi:hypothetical protein
MTIKEIQTSLDYSLTHGKKAPHEEGIDRCRMERVDAQSIIQWLKSDDHTLTTDATGENFSYGSAMIADLFIPGAGPKRMIFVGSDASISSLMEPQRIETAFQEVILYPDNPESNGMYMSVRLHVNGEVDIVEVVTGGVTTYDSDIVSPGWGNTRIMDPDYILVLTDVTRDDHKKAITIYPEEE